jgi:hypothetical protein
MAASRERGEQMFLPSSLPFNRTSRKVLHDRATAQAMSPRIPVAEAWVRSQVRSRGICGGQSGSGVGFLRISGRSTKMGYLTPSQETKH